MFLKVQIEAQVDSLETDPRLTPSVTPQTDSKIRSQRDRTNGQGGWTYRLERGRPSHRNSQYTLISDLKKYKKNTNPEIQKKYKEKYPKETMKHVMHK